MFCVDSCGRARDVPAVPVAGGFAVALGALGEDGVEEGERRDGGEGGGMHLVLTKAGGFRGKEAWRRTKQTETDRGTRNRGGSRQWYITSLLPQRDPVVPDPGGGKPSPQYTTRVHVVSLDNLLTRKRGGRKGEKTDLARLTRWTPPARHRGKTRRTARQ